MIFHPGRIFVRIGKDLAIRGNHRQSGSRFLSCLAAKGLKTRLIIVSQIDKDTAGHEMSTCLKAG